MIKYEPIILEDWEDAEQLIKLLYRNDYVTMLSSEDGNYRIDFRWQPNGDRQNIIFEEAGD
jgi:hypothetical protein